MNDDKRKACLQVLVMLRTPLMMMSKAAYAETLDVAVAYSITAEDLLTVARDKARKL